MQHITPRFRIKGKEYVLLRKGDNPCIIEVDRLEEELKQGAQYYPPAADPDFQGWVEIPDEHFRQLETEGCLEEAEMIPGEPEGMVTE